jgi:hypothetical protein
MYKNVERTRKSKNKKLFDEMKKKSEAKNVKLLGCYVF